MGACRVFKLAVRGLPLCRLIGRWIKSGKINGLPRKGVKMSFRLLGEPVQQPSLMKAELGLQLAARGRGGTGDLDWETPAATDGWNRFHDWDRQQRARRRRGDAASGISSTALRHVDTTDPFLIPGTDAADSAARDGVAERDGMRGAPITRVREENAPVAALPVGRTCEAGDGELDGAVFSACRRPGEWGDGADIKARLHHWQTLLCAGRA